MTKKLKLIGVGAFVMAIAGVLWWFAHRGGNDDLLVLYGNVDLRTVDLPFYGSERIAVVTAQEGDRVHGGEVLARLDTSRLIPQLERAQAEVEAQRAVVERLHHGSRPEEIQQARANFEQARADAFNAKLEYGRQKVLLDNSATSKEAFDNAKTAAKIADDKAELNRKALELAIKGPRKEDIEQAEAQLRASEAQLALLRQQVADSELVAPLNAVVRSRLMEPGEMASPLTPVFSLAITDPKWIRAYVSETELGLVHPGMNAKILVDSFPNRVFSGWIGFVSPIAEFTPKTVETTELRPSLVYEVRVFVTDSQDDLRLGMPATVQVPLHQRTPEAPHTQPPMQVPGLQR
jgi:membrane fusion protein PltH